MQHDTRQDKTCDRCMAMTLAELDKGSVINASIYNGSPLMQAVSKAVFIFVAVILVSYIFEEVLYKVVQSIVNIDGPRVLWRLLQ